MEGNPYSYAENSPLSYVDPDGQGLVGVIKEYSKPVLRTAAFGTILYYAAQRDNPFDDPLGFLATSVTASALFDAGEAYIGSLPNPELAEEYSNVKSRHRISRKDIQPYVDLIRNSGVEKAAEVASALEKTAESGLIFSSTIPTLPSQLGSIEGIGVIDIDSGIRGFVDPSTGLTALALLDPNFVYSYNTVVTENLALISHEGYHHTQRSTQGRWRFTINKYFGFSWQSRFNLIEEPARQFESGILDVYLKSPRNSIVLPSSETIPEF